MTTWNERFRVTERRRPSLYGFATTRSDGWIVEVRMSGDGEPEQWSSPAAMAVFGPPALLDAIEAARVAYAEEGGAKRARDALVVAMASAFPAGAS